MMSRRALFGAAVAGAVIGTREARASTCSGRLYVPDLDDRPRLREGAERFRHLYNRSDLETLVGEGLDYLSIHDQPARPERQVSELRALRERWGRILTRVSWNHCMVSPEYPILYFVAAMEDYGTEDDMLARSLSCAHAGSHHRLMFTLGFDVDDRSPSVTGKLRSVRIGWA